MIKQYSFNKIDYKLFHFDQILNDPKLMNIVRTLTLHKESGLNYEIDHLITVARNSKSVKAKAIIAYEDEEAIAWILMTREESKRFTPLVICYSSKDGVMVQLYVESSFRRKGIGKNLVKLARRHAGPYKLCVCPWDYKSQKFFISKSFKTLQNKNIWSEYYVC